MRIKQVVIAVILLAVSTACGPPTDRCAAVTCEAGLTCNAANGSCEPKSGHDEPPEDLTGAIAETEPNETKSQVDATGITLTGPAIVTGTLGEAEADLYKLTLSHVADKVVRIELRSPLGCAAIEKTKLTLLWEHGVENATDDLKSGCLLVVSNLFPGTYYLAVSRLGNATPIPYSLRVSFPDVGGAEVEPNDSTFNATAFAGNDHFKAGNLKDLSDIDYFEFTLTAPSLVRAEIIEGDLAGRCERTFTDTILTLESGTGHVYATDEDSGRGGCSRIDGLATAGAAQLQPGTYFWKISSSPKAMPHIFYRLVVKITGL